MGLWKVLMNVSPRVTILSMSLANDANLCHSFDTYSNDNDDDDDNDDNDDTLIRMPMYSVVHPTELLELYDPVHVKINVFDHLDDLPLRGWYAECL